MKPSQNKLKQILADRNRSWSDKLTDWYLEKYLLVDFAIGLSIVIIQFLLSKYILTLINVDISAFPDILNELISSSLSLGGFVLAALAIISGTKATVTETEKGNRPKTGKEYFYNSKGYLNVIEMYSLSCFVFLGLFIYFTTLRVTAVFLDPYLFTSLLLFGTVIIIMTFFRSVLLLWQIIKI